MRNVKINRTKLFCSFEQNRKLSVHTKGVTGQSFSLRIGGFMPIGNHCDRTRRLRPCGVEAKSSGPVRRRPFVRPGLLHARDVCFGKVGLHSVVVYTFPCLHGFSNWMAPAIFGRSPATGSRARWVAVFGTTRLPNGTTVVSPVRLSPLPHFANTRRIEWKTRVFPCPHKQRSI